MGHRHLQTVWWKLAGSNMSYVTVLNLPRSRTEIEAQSHCVCLWVLWLSFWCVVWISVCTHDLSAHPALDSSVETAAWLQTEIGLKKRIKKKSGIFGDVVIYMTWTPQVYSHRIYPGTVRYVGTLGGVTQNSLRLGQGLPQILALSRSDWGNCSSIFKPGGTQTQPAMCPGQNPVHTGKVFRL